MASTSLRQERPPRQPTASRPTFSRAAALTHDIPFFGGVKKIRPSPILNVKHKLKAPSIRQVMTSLAKLVLADTGGVGRQVTLNNLNAVVDFPSRVCLVLWYGTHRFSSTEGQTVVKNHTDSSRRGCTRSNASR